MYVKYKYEKYKLYPVAYCGERQVNRGKCCRGFFEANRRNRRPHVRTAYGTCGSQSRGEERADRNSKPPPMNLCREAIPVGEGDCRGGGGQGLLLRDPPSLPPSRDVAAMSFVAYCRPQAPLVNRVRSRKIESSPARPRFSRFWPAVSNGGWLGSGGIAFTLSVAH